MHSQLMKFLAVTVPHLDTANIGEYALAPLVGLNTKAINKYEF